MPYIAFELDALKRVPAAARSAGVPEAELGFGLVRLWEHCWSEKTDHVEAAHLAGFFGGDRGRVTEALAAFRFLEADSDGFRVRGADRYLRISKARSEGGKKAAAAGNLKKGELKALSSSLPAPSQLQLETSSSCAPALSPNTEHRITKEDLPTATEILSPSVLKQPKAVAVVEHFPSVVPDPDEADRQLRGEDGSFRPTGLGFCGWWNDARLAQGLSGELFNTSETAQWADRCMAEVGQERFWRAAHAFLDDEFWRPKGWPLAVFRSDSVWRTRANDPPPPKRVRT